MTSLEYLNDGSPQALADLYWVLAKVRRQYSMGVRGDALVGLCKGYCVQRELATMGDRKHAA